MEKVMKILLSLGAVAVMCAAAYAEEPPAQAVEGSSAQAFIGQDLLPPGAEPGECYARVFVPPTYKYVTEQMLKKEASERLEMIPPQYQWVEEQVMTKAPAERLELIPATYDWVQEQVLVKEASSRMEEVPAIYETTSEQILKRPAHTVWKKGTGPLQKIDNATGEILCLVEVPARYETVYKRVLVKPATTREITIPAEYKTLKRRVMTNPPTTRKIDIPAEYKTVKVRKLVKPAEFKRIPIPAEYQTVSKRVQVTEGGMEWRRILCQTNLDRETVSSIQRALLKAGFHPGPIDGILGKLTFKALRSYQEDKGLGVGNLTYETIESLGVKFKPAT
jgi:hypothetical protein